MNIIGYATPTKAQDKAPKKAPKKATKKTPMNNVIFS